MSFFSNLKISVTKFLNMKKSSKEPLEASFVHLHLKTAINAKKALVP